MSHKEKLTSFGALCVIGVVLGGFLFGYHLGVISGALIFLAKAFALSTAEEGMVVGILLLGALVGALCSGYLSDRLGRKRTILITSLWFIAGSLLSATAQSLTILLIGRLICGVGVGLISLVAPLYLAEIAPTHHRGAIVSFNQFAITVGIFSSYLINYLFADSEGWRWMFALGAIPALLQLISTTFLPETPEWLLMHQEKEKALGVLKRIRQDDLWKGHLKEMKESASTRKNSNWSALFHPSVRFPLFVGITISIFQQITGINGVVYYAPKIFQSAGFTSAKLAIFASLGIGAVNVMATFIALRLLDRAGRRPLLLTGTIGMGVSLAVLGTAFLTQSPFISILSVSMLMCFIVFFAMGFGPIPWLILSEIYPLSIRGRAMSLAIIANWISNYLISVLFLKLIEGIGSGGTFLVFAGISLVALYFVYRCVPETKGKSLEEIEASLKNRRI